MGLGCLGLSWCISGVSGARLGYVLKRQGCVLEGSWSHLGASWQGLGGILGSLGGFLGAFWEHFRRIFCHLDEYVKIAKNVGKPIVFH